MDGYNRRGYSYGRPQSQSPWHDPYQKGPSWGRGITSLIKDFMMMQQLKEERGEERGEKEWERGFKEEEQARKFERWGVQEDLWEAQTERVSRPDVPAELKVPDFMQKANALIAAAETGGEKMTIGEALNRVLKIKEPEPTEPGIKKSRQKWLEGLDKTIDTMIKGIQNRPEYGMDEELTTEVTNLQQAKTKIRAGLLLGADQPLTDTMWGDLGKISEKLEQIQKSGLYPPEKKPLKGLGKLPKMKKSELPPGTEVKWNPKLNIKMAKIDGVWYWVHE